MHRLHPSDCAQFEYEQHHKRNQVLRSEIPKILGELRRGVITTEQAAADSRTIHARIFSSLTPPGFSYFAGHFRGEDFRCLKYYTVGVAGDPRVGHAPETVKAAMDALIYRVRSALAKIDMLTDPLAQFTYSIRLACNIFELLLRIHPYANGNGHMARLAVWAILGRYGRWPERWPVEPRPPTEPYILLIQQYRSGNRQPLEEFMIRIVLGQEI
ncbi:MAG: Fic family protein [Candidatus Binataceae bacterium]